MGEETEAKKVPTWRPSDTVLTQQHAGRYDLWSPPQRENRGHLTPDSAFLASPPGSFRPENYMLGNYARKLHHNVLSAIFLLKNLQHESTPPMAFVTSESLYCIFCVTLSKSLS